MSVELRTDATRLQERFAAALAELRGNLRPVNAAFDRPVLVEGGVYGGIWLECGPLEGLAYAMVDEAAALDNHRIFFRMQREDGYLPCHIRVGKPAGSAQIQMVVPIAATAWDLFEMTNDAGFLEEAYAACTRWDAWLARYRDTRGTGLCEAFCEYDTGHDNSPRWAGLPHACPEGDARRCPEAGALPYLAPDLSATVYGGRVALVRMARAMGRFSEAEQWDDKAERTRRAILAHCFCAEDGCFYDLDRNGKFVRIRGDVITRVMGEHVPDRELFEAVYRRHIKDPEAFWTPYPLPSIAANDPTFVREIPRNSWGGASQALTALRTPRWFGHYGKDADLVHLMRQWVRALTAADGFMQQMNPWTGVFNTSPGYSPAMLTLIEFVSRLHGVRRQGNELEWSCGLLPDGATRCAFKLDGLGVRAELAQEKGEATLRLGGTDLARVRGVGRIVTDLRGGLKRVVAISDGAPEVTARGLGCDEERRLAWTV